MPGGRVRKRPGLPGGRPARIGPDAWQDTMREYEARVTQAPGVPLLGVVFVSLSADDLANTRKFDSTGLGKGSFTGWALANGSNGTSSVADYGALKALMRIA